jgi:hypothetical protein
MIISHPDENFAIDLKFFLEREGKNNNNKRKKIVVDSNIIIILSTVHDISIYSNQNSHLGAISINNHNDAC